MLFASRSVFIHHLVALRNPVRYPLILLPIDATIINGRILTFASRTALRDTVVRSPTTSG